MDVGVLSLNFYMYSNRNRVKEVFARLSCTKVERAYIKSCAKKSGKSISTYLRQGALQGFTGKDKSLPVEVLALQGQLAHVCGLLEVIVRKRLDGEDLNALERAQLSEASQSLQEIILHLKDHLS